MSEQVGSDQADNEPRGEIATNFDDAQLQDFRAPDELLKAQSLADTLDSAVKLPIIKLRVGLDFLVGLIPFVGDFIMLLPSLKIVHYGYKLGLPQPLVRKMFINSMVDFGLGFVPFLGDIFDLLFKANQRNVKIMENWWVADNRELLEALALQQSANTQ